MGLYGVPLSMSLLGFGIGTMLANFHMCGIMLLLREACHDTVTCYFYVVLLPLGLKLW